MAIKVTLLTESTCHKKLSENVCVIIYYCITSAKQLTYFTIRPSCGTECFAK